jgi:non-specific serine/threonine protein kinase
MASPLLGQSSLVARKLGHYHLVEKIGAGGMGEVYRARDEHLDRDVAIKVLCAGLLADEASRRRFHGEAMALSKLAHPNIASVYDFDTHEGIDFLVTEYIPGVTLSEKLAQGPLPERDVVELGMQLAEGLAAAHSRALVHRDLKPGNLRVTADDRLKILDFGLAIRLPAISDATASTVTGAAELAGTLAYMAPEQLRGEPIDFRTDLYAAGAVLYEMVSGRPPFEEKLSPPLIDAILHRPPKPPRSIRPSLSARLEEIILRCLEKNPEHRYQSARDLLADLRRASIAAVGAERSLAVLYFENLGGQKEDEYFRDGITEDITTEISKIRELRVFSRSAVLAYRDKPVTPSHVGQQLNATHIVEGSVRREADRLRITAKLVDTRTGHALWAERYDRQFEHVFAIQDEIAHSIAAALRVVLTEKEKDAIEKVPTADVRAYDFYLRGRHFFHQFRRKGLDLAREMFARAIALDPNYARAYAGIADCCTFLYIYWESSQANLDQAYDAGRRALDLDPDLAEAHASKGLSASLRKNYEEAQREFATAIRLNPRLFEPYYFSGRNFYVQGKLEEAVRWFEQASRALPEDYQAPMLMASALHGLGRMEDAQTAYRRGLAAAEKHLEIHPDDARAVYFGANALTQLNDKERALKWAEHALQMEPDEHQVLYNVACVYALLGEAERAIDCLEKSVTGGWGQREWMEHDPDLASIRDHARFKALLNAPLGAAAGKQ